MPEEVHLPNPGTLGRNNYRWRQANPAQLPVHCWIEADGEFSNWDKSLPDFSVSLMAQSVF